LASELPDNEVGKIIKYQIIKSGTSVGANYREKIDICETEASETQYWLEVIIEAQLLSWSRVKPYTKNAQSCWLFSQLPAIQLKKRENDANQRR
jgi:four helix bundle protein